MNKDIMFTEIPQWRAVHGHYCISTYWCKNETGYIAAYINFDIS